MEALVIWVIVVNILAIAIIGGIVLTIYSYVRNTDRNVEYIRDRFRQAELMESTGKWRDKRRSFGDY